MYGILNVALLVTFVILLIVLRPKKESGPPAEEFPDIIIDFDSNEGNLTGYAISQHPGYDTLDYKIVGGGGGGGKGTAEAGGGGGGGGQYKEGTVSVGNSDYISTFKGAGGNGGSIGTVNVEGSDGTATTFTIGSTVTTANAGRGGKTVLVVVGSDEAGVGGNSGGGMVGGLPNSEGVSDSMEGGSGSGGSTALGAGGVVAGGNGGSGGGLDYLGFGNGAKGILNTVPGQGNNGTGYGSGGGGTNNLMDGKPGLDGWWRIRIYKTVV